MGATTGSTKGEKGKTGDDVVVESEFVTLTVHRACAMDFLAALNLALAGGGGKKKGKGKGKGKKGGGGGGKGGGKGGKS